MLPLVGWGANPAVDSTATTNSEAQIVFAFCSPLCYFAFAFSTGCFAWPLAPKPKPVILRASMWTSQGFQLVVSSRRSEKRRSAMINQMVSSPYRYVSGKGYVFSRHIVLAVGRVA